MNITTKTRDKIAFAIDRHISNMVLAQFCVNDMMRIISSEGIIKCSIGECGEPADMHFCPKHWDKSVNKLREILNKRQEIFPPAFLEFIDELAKDMYDEREDIHSDAHHLLKMIKEKIDDINDNSNGSTVCVANTSDDNT